MDHLEIRRKAVERVKGIEPSLRAASFYMHFAGFFEHLVGSFMGSRPFYFPLFCTLNGRWR
jgi:hypothetical protein